MNPPKYTAIDYINFLIGTQKAYSCTEAVRVQPENSSQPAHNAINRLLNRLKPTSEGLWTKAQAWVSLTNGILVSDDTTLDKWYAAKMELVTRQNWSGKHGRVVQGINLTTLLWSDGDVGITSSTR